MKRTKLADRVLPNYTKGEEIMNMTTHIVGGALGILAIVLCVIISSIHRNWYGLASGIVYGISMLVLYTMSSIYHGLSPKLTAKKVFQILDHCTIFILIAGTYTPYCLVTLREIEPISGWILFGIVWLMAAIGIVFNAIDIKKYKKFSMICYLVMGWCVVFKIKVLYEALGVIGFNLLLAGGIVYTIGAVFYSIGKKHKYMHSVFHLFVLAASVLQFLSIILYVM